ncbi:hypothetical protein SAMN04487916_11166 [Arthrobacter sp. ov407]|uniref:hypothetical protein n=1 Tax=Arthrobacter sp. ov407 TaxID=1761748 RepID=UPI0008837AA2|nr:hypothetical protein [Arthrobacter sp. ov407]SDL60325.1 hypothetical protein SAMN04487916_11166 [Arthrobacter sp. ov407]
MTRNQDIDTLLRSLDAADHGGSANTQRARTDLHRILSADPSSVPSQRPALTTAAGKDRQPRGTGRSARRFAVVGGMVAVVTAGTIILPSLSGGDPAFASWTSTPTGLTETERASAVAECRASKKNVGGGMYADDVDSAEVAIAERRGVWTTVVLTGKDGFSALCITDDSVSLFGRGTTGSVGKPAGYAVPGPRELTATALGTGTMSAGDISLAAGTAGSDIVGVIYKSRTHEDVTATVSQGHFALWLPGDELRNASSDGVEVEVTYRDGTTGTSRLTL